MQLTTEQNRVMTFLADGGATAFRVAVETDMGPSQVSRIMQQLKYRSLVRCDGHRWVRLPSPSLSES